MRKLITVIFLASGAVLITAFFVVKFNLRPAPARILQEKTPEQSQTQRKIRILVVPGHEPNYGGAEFGSIKERDLVVELGQDLEQFLKADNNYQVFITRDTQAWSPIFADYFKNNWDDIAAWKKAARKEMSRLVSAGTTAIPAPAVIHNNIPADVAVRLYGINKWANENNIDLVIHVHINDYWGYPANVPGKYSGFVIYLPAQQYSNSVTTKAIAEAVFNRLAKYNPVSNLRQESAGLVSDSELIAVGANNTSDAANMLIEYNYIYEPQFTNPKIRGLALKDLAYQTYLGLQDFFGGSNDNDSANLYNP
ncbi:MAG: N-acetylmuramoyl-L-alanine amidase [Candidatus Azambacteria bacterium]|nr:N-acetylmuramoyl-L-alanine amidase [Candidatus Azambacteria bacterium]